MQPDNTIDDVRSLSLPSTLSVRELARLATAMCIVSTEQERYMNKWTILQNSKVIRITASAGTLVAVATLVGAGYKWS